MKSAATSRRLVNRGYKINKLYNDMSYQTHLIGRFCHGSYVYFAGFVYSAIVWHVTTA